MSRRREIHPVTNCKALDRLVAYGKNIPEAADEFSPHAIIRRVRNALRMTQAQLAKRAGMPQSHLAKIESGKVDVQLSTLRRLFRAVYCEIIVLPKFKKSPQAALAYRIQTLARQNVMRALSLENRRYKDKEIRALLDSEEGLLMNRPASKIWDEAESDGASVARDATSVRIIDKEGERDDLEYWLKKSPEERIAAVEFLREQYYAMSGYKSLPRLAHVIQVRERLA